MPSARLRRLVSATRGGVGQRQKVAIGAIQKRSDGRKRPWLVRWTVDGVEARGQSFTTKKGADHFRAELVQAEADGVRFDSVTGCPVSTVRTTSETMATWCRAYMAQTWGTAAPNTRRSIGPALVWGIERSIRDGAPPLTEALHKELAVWLRPGAHEPSYDLAAWLRWSPNLAEMDKPALYELDRRLRLRTGGPGEPLGAALGKEAAGKSVKTVRLCLDTAVDAGLMVANAWPVPKKGESRRRANRPKKVLDSAVILTPVQATALLEAIPTHQPGSRAYAAMAAVGLYAGARPSECVALSVEDFSLPDSGWGTVSISQAWAGAGEQWGEAAEDLGDPKTDAGTRAFPIPPVLVRAIQAWMEFSGITAGRLFPTRSGGRPTASNYGRALARAAATAGVPAPSPYDLRHTAASWMSNEGVPIAEAARRHGSTVEVMLRWYIHAVPGVEERTNALMDAFYDTTSAPR